MQRRYTAATLFLLMTTAGCSSGPPTLKLSSGALPGGTAEVVVDRNETNRIHDVQCESIGKGLTRINIGARSARTTLLVGGEARTPMEVTFSGVEGFTGSYWKDLQGSARLVMIDQTYRLTGSAAGFNADRPYIRTMDDFTVTVAC